MTNSGKQTKAIEPLEPAVESAAPVVGQLPMLQGRVAWIAFAVWSVLGVFGVGSTHHWDIGPGAAFLFLGWLAVFGTGMFIWNAVVSMATEGTGADHEGFDLSGDLVGELLQEKRAVLKAIKEVEFDREMGKMSERDAEQMIRFYRARAIEILKDLDRIEDDGEDSVHRAIEREVRARLEVVGVRRRGQAQARSRGAAQKKRKEVAKKAGSRDQSADSKAEKAEEKEAAAEVENDSAEVKPEAKAAEPEAKAAEPEVKTAEAEVEAEAEETAEPVQEKTS